MNIFIIFSLGLLLGSIITLTIREVLSGNGYFKLVPYDEENTGFYRINVRIISNQDLMKKRYIVLRKED